MSIVDNNKNAHVKPYFGHSPKIEEVKAEINMAAPHNCAVLILGETGTGKGMTARWIHDHSPRRDGAFVEINCAGLRGELLKSELFGHAMGAFTGAIRDHAGLIEEADGGTLFLDEIGDMDIGVQCLLLKAIEDKVFRRVGENRMRKSDFRLVCATNRDLLDAVSKDQFREDLYYRINTIVIRMPSLRERVDDLRGLAEYTLKTMGYGRFPVCGEVIEALSRRRWRGNIRELRNTLCRALILANGGELTVEHFPEVKPAAPERADGREDSYMAQMELLRDVWDLGVLEKVHIRRALSHFGEDKVRICAALGISPSSLYRKLERMRNESAA